MFDATVSVRMPVDAGTAFDYLVEPRNRPQWQSSLGGVDVLTPGPPTRGTRWIDRTRAGIRPEMTLAIVDRPTLWTEASDWHGLVATLSMSFEPVDAHTTEVHVAMVFDGPLWWQPIAALAALAAPRAVRGDLARAARILASR
ncbi:MAG TPA: SRPBCC family protein [Marmoricola sp.]|nr:SRPBCC family protein [Marmoricola sp.]